MHKNIPVRAAKIFILCVALSVGPLGSLAAPAPSNGTRFPDKGKMESGYEYNVMFKATLSHSKGDLKTQGHFYTLSFGACNWLSLDGKIGFGDVVERGAADLPKLEYNTGFAGGYGFRVRAYNNEKWGMRVILGGQHICVHPHARSIDNDKYEAILDDWQLSGLAAKDFSLGAQALTAYAGMKGSDCEIIYKLNKHDRKRCSSDRHIGLITGLELYLFNNKTRVNVEGRFFDETALTTSVSYAF